MHSNKQHNVFSTGTSKTSRKRYRRRTRNKATTSSTTTNQPPPTNSSIRNTLSRIHAKHHNILLLNHPTNADDSNLHEKINETIKEFNLITSSIDNQLSTLQYLFDNDNDYSHHNNDHPTRPTTNNNQHTAAFSSFFNDFENTLN
jgi:hypothetical protein